VKTLRAADADIVALQETNRRSQRYLLAKLRREYPYCSFHQAPAAGGFGFLSKIPLRNVRHHRLEHGWFGAYVAEIPLSRRTIRVVNLHLQPTLPERGESLFGFMTRWRRTALTRVLEIQQVLAELPDADRSNLILIGDFNSLPGGIVTRTLQNMGFVDGYASVTPEKERKTTWQWRVGEYLIQYRLDYCFHGSGFKTIRSSILRCDASDHHLILNTLQRQSIDKK
jgi:endonuclease/exonuclease/phosphatase family metal-dependent hydrolase